MRLGCAWLVAVTSGSLLTVAAFLGLFVRPTSDDWCGVTKTRDMGVLGITRDFYETQNGRVANAFVTGLVYTDGLLGPKILPTLLVLGMTSGLLTLLRMLDRRLGWGVPRPFALAAVLTVEAVVLLAGTRPYQALLWAPATISHTLPGILGIWSVVLALAAARRGRGSRRAAVVCAVAVGAVVGTLSEPFTAVSGIFAGAAAALLLLPGLRARTWFPLAWCAGWCGGLVAGFTVLYTSPGARWRRAQEPPTDGLLSVKGLRADVHDWLHVWQSVTHTWAYLAAPAVGLLLGFCCADRFGSRGAEAEAGRGASDSTERASSVLAAGWAWRCLLLVLPAVLVLVASFGVVVGLRMGYGPTGWQYARAWTNFLLPMTLLLCGYGALLGRWAARPRVAARSQTSRPAAMALSVLATAVCLSSMATIVPALRDMTGSAVVRAQAWDRQDAAMKHQARDGVTDAAYHPLPVGYLAEPFFTRTYSRDWVAACVSQYYRVQRIHKK
ncbi:DUF6056 family protein [Actinacidiphila bryophytorum]|uniref:DUF6056 family protein n=1 Tax=Actinacidiphila bryophytorum TaxID=1436133 RepID=UPI002176D2AC|nr:DUF6056 family protein [Actinacidiphila bryophytorum]UWE12192.1 DUF6056 family protein [Actinacidiphila bryophytorum]